MPDFSPEASAQLGRHGFARVGLALLPIAFAAFSCRSDSVEVEYPAPSLRDADASGAEDSPEALAPAAYPVEAASPASPTSPSSPAQGRDILEQESERLTVLEQRQEFLAQQFIQQGDALFERADLQGALEAYSQALEVAPSNEDAREKLGRVRALMGDEFGTASDLVEDAAAREAVRRAQARISAEEAMQRGDQALREGNYDTAVQAYREAELILQYQPVTGVPDLDAELVAGKLEQALVLQDEALRREADARTQQANLAEAERQKAEATYRETKLRLIYEEATAAFLSENYARAESLVNQILLIEPQNQTALHFREVAQNARHQKEMHRMRRDYREQWMRTFQELDTLDVPQTESLVFDDLKRWRDVSQRKPLAFVSQDSLTNADREAVLARIEAVRFAPRFVGPDGEGAPLEEVATYLQNLSGVNFLLSPAVRDLSDEEKTVKLELPERSVRKVLDLIAETSEVLRWKIEDGVVKFVTAEELTGGQVLQMYEVRDIVHPIPDFPGREINVVPSGGTPEIDEELAEREGLVVTSDKLDQLIRDNIASESWDLDPANSMRITESGTLVVNQTPEVHDLIQQLLDQLREATGIMVDIQTRFLRVEDNFLEDIGVDFRGLGQPGLGTNAFFNDFGDASTQAELGQEIGQDTDLGAFYDDGEDGDFRSRIENLYDVTLGEADVLTGSGGLSFQWTFLNDLQLELILRAVSKSERLELVTAPRLLVFNTARSNITVMNQVAYVQDFDVEIAQAASIADPVIGVVQDGVILDVRPVVSADRRFIMMELRPTVAELLRPIREMATSLGSQNSVTIQLPELDIQRVRTTVPMPDGGTVLLGGLKVSEKKDLRSGVPVVNKIPIVSFLFERKGTFISNRKLIVLLRAQIVIPSEHEPSEAQLGL
jgi:type II secretory pathway component GspD/PulD (secretin)